MAGTRKISLREEAYKVLQNLQKQYGATSLSDTVLLLAEKAAAYGKLEERLQKIEKRLDELEATLRKIELLLVRVLEELKTGKGSAGFAERRELGGKSVGEVLSI